MSELYEKSLTKLELDRVLDLLAGHAGSPDGAGRRSVTRRSASSVRQTIRAEVPSGSDSITASKPS